MKLTRNLFLLIVLCVLHNYTFAQATIWKHSFGPNEITVDNYNDPIILTDDYGGESFIWNFEPEWLGGNDISIYSSSDYVAFGDKKETRLTHLNFSTEVPGKILTVKIGISGSNRSTLYLTTSIGDYQFEREQIKEQSDNIMTFENSSNAEGVLNFFVDRYGSYVSTAVFIYFIEIIYIPVPQPTDASIVIGESGYTTYSNKKALDFSQVTDAQGNTADITAYVVPGYYVGGYVGVMKAGGNAVSLNRTIPAKTGLVIKGDPGEYHVQFANGNTNVFSNFLIPAVEPIFLLPDDGEYKNFVLVGDEFEIVNSEGIYFGPNEAYLKIPTDYVIANNINTLKIVEVEDELGIDTSILNTDTDSNTWYSITGLKITQPLKKGVYIHNNKAVIVK